MSKMDEEKYKYWIFFAQCKNWLHGIGAEVGRQKWIPSFDYYIVLYQKLVTNWVFPYIYIYIYIVIHRQICFVLSELISVASFP